MWAKCGQDSSRKQSIIRMSLFLFLRNLPYYFCCIEYFGELLHYVILLWSLLSTESSGYHTKA